MAVPKYGPLAYTPPTVDQIQDIVSAIPKPVINVTPINRLAQQNVPAPTPTAGGVPTLQPQLVTDKRQMIAGRQPLQTMQTGPETFKIQPVPVPQQFTYTPQPIPTTKTGKEQQPKQPEKTKEWYVVQDRRNELVSYIKAQNPTTASQYTDDEMIDTYLKQFPERRDFYSYPLGEQEQMVVDSIRASMPGAEQYSNEELIQMYNQQMAQNPNLRPPQMQEQQPINSALKGAPQQFDDKGLFGIPKVPRIEKPLAPFNPETDVGAPNVGKMYANMPTSAFNVASDLGNIVIAPDDFLVGLARIASGVGVKTAKGVIKAFGGKYVDERVAIALDRMKRKGGVLGQVAQALETNEQTAEAVRTMLDERYGGSEEIAKTMTEDPFGILSDIALFVEGGGALIKRGGKLTKSQKIARIGQEMQLFGEVTDPYAFGIIAGTRGVQKAVGRDVARGGEAGGGIPPSKEGEVTLSDRMASSYFGLDSETIRRMKDNAELIGEIQRGETSVEDIRNEVVNIVDTLESERGNVGQLYNESYASDIRFSSEEIKTDIINNLAEQGVKFTPDGQIELFDVRNPAMAGITDEAKNAIKSKFAEVMQILSLDDTLSVQDLHNIRKSLNQTIYLDQYGKSKKAPGVQKIVDGINAKLKKVPGFDVADKAYSKSIEELRMVRKYLTTTDPEGKLQLRGALKSLLRETGAGKLDVIERYIPGFRKKVEAIVAYEDFIQTRNRKKVGLYEKAGPTTTGGIIGLLFGGPLGGLMGGFAGPIISDFIRDPKRFLQWVTRKVGKKTAEKIKNGSKLSKAERARLDFQAEQLINRPEIAMDIYEQLYGKAKPKAGPSKSTEAIQETLQKKSGQEATKAIKQAIKLPGQKPKEAPKVETPQKVIDEEQESRIREQQARKMIQEQKKLTTKEQYDKAPGTIIKNVADFKKGMITPDGIITETGFDRGTAYYKVEGDSKRDIRRSGEAKSPQPVKIPGKKPEPKKEFEPKGQELAEQEMATMIERQARLETLADDITTRYGLTPEQVRELEAEFEKLIEDEAKAIEEEIMQADYEDRAKKQIRKAGSNPVEQRLTDRVLSMEAREQRLGKVGKNKIIDKNYKDKQRSDFTRDKERLIELIGEELDLDATQARDWYDKKADEASLYRKKFQVKKELTTLYHGTSEEFMEFKASKIGSGEGSLFFGEGVDLTDNLDVAKGYATGVTMNKLGIERKLGEDPMKSQRIQAYTQGKRNIKTVQIGDARIYDIEVNREDVNRFLRDSESVYTKSEWDEEYGKKHLSEIDLTPSIVNDARLSQAVAGYVKRLGYDGLSYPVKDTNMGRRQNGRNYKIFDPKKATIVKQEMYQIQREVAKNHLSPAEAEARVRAYFGPDELPVHFVDNITTPWGQEAYGYYLNNAIYMIKEPHTTTPTHEVLHAYFDMFTDPQRQRAVLEEIKKKHNITDDIEAEEILADGFVEFVNKRGKNTGFKGAIKNFFKDVRAGMKAIFGQEDKARRLYMDIIQKRRPPSAGKKQPRIVPQTKQQPYVSSKPIQDVMKEIKGDVSVSYLKNLLGRAYKSQEISQVMEAIRIAEEKGGKLTKDEAMKIMQKKILPLEISPYALDSANDQRKDYNGLYNNQGNAQTHMYTGPFEHGLQNGRHFDRAIYDAEQYFGHVRVENVPGEKARIIEIQSDTFQDKEKIKNLEKSTLELLAKRATHPVSVYGVQAPYEHLVIGKDLREKLKDLLPGQLELTQDVIKDIYSGAIKSQDNLKESFRGYYMNANRWRLTEPQIDQAMEMAWEVYDTIQKKGVPYIKEYLEYAKKGAYRKRMISEEIALAYETGKKKIQVPTGATASMIEYHKVNLKTADDSLVQIAPNKYITQEQLKDLFMQMRNSSNLTEHIQKRAEDYDFLWRRSSDIAMEALGLADKIEEYAKTNMGIEIDEDGNWGIRDLAMFKQGRDYLEKQRLAPGYEGIVSYWDEFDEFVEKKDSWTDEEEVKAIKAITSDTHRTISEKYHFEIIPYLQKTFGGEFVFEDGGRWFEIDLEKLFSDKSRLALPAYEAKQQPYITSKPIQDIQTEIKGDVVSVQHLETMLGRQYKRQEMSQIMETIRIAKEKGGTLSKNKAMEIMRDQIVPLEPKKASKRENYNALYRGRQTSIVWEMPIKTQTANHFYDENYFAHTRVEDLDDMVDQGISTSKYKNATRIVEMQSDLFQHESKGINRNFYSEINNFELGINTFHSWDMPKVGAEKTKRDYYATSTLWETEKGYKYPISKELFDKLNNMSHNEITAIAETIRAINVEDLNNNFLNIPKKQIVDIIEAYIKVSNEFNQMPRKNLDARHFMKEGGGLDHAKINDTADLILQFIRELGSAPELKPLEEYFKKGARRKRVLSEQIAMEYAKGKRYIQFPSGATIAKIEGHKIKLGKEKDFSEIPLMGDLQGYSIKRTDIKDTISEVMGSDDAVEILEQAIPFMMEYFKPKWENNGEYISVRNSGMSFSSYNEFFQFGLRKFFAEKAGLFLGEINRENTYSEKASKLVQSMKIPGEKEGALGRPSGVKMPLGRVDYTAVGDPALFSQFLSDNPDFKITKIIKERATKSDTIEKQLRTDEEEINAINAMSNKTHQTIATKYQKEYRPYLQKTFGGEVVFEDGGKRLTIDMEKYFKDPKKLGLPAYQRKPEYSKIMEIEETIRSVMSKQGTPEFGRFTIGQHIAGLQDYLVQNYPRQKQFIYQKISELITKHNVNDDFSAEVKKNREASMASAKKRWDKYKQPNKIDTLIELTPDTNSLLGPISLKEYMQIGKIPTEALGQYYEKFFKRLNNAFKERPGSVDTRNLSIEIDNLVEHDLMTNRDADKYKNMVSLMAQKRQGGVPKFQTKPGYGDDDRFKEQPIKIPGKKQMETPEPMKSWDEEIIGQSFTKDERYTFDFEYGDGRKVYKFRSPEGEILAEVTVKNGKIIDYNSDVDYEVNPRISYDPKDYRDNDMSGARFQTKDVISKQAEKYLTEWTYGAKNKSPLNQPKLTKEIEQELSKFKPKQPVKLYRAQKKGDKNQRLTSWTYDKDMAYAMIGIPEADFGPKMDGHEVITKKIHPDEILVDFTMLPKMKEEYINEVIVKPMQKQGVPKFQVKGSEGGQKAIPLSKVDNALIAEARKYKSADEFIEGYKTSKIKVFEDNVEEIGNIQTIRHDLHSYDPEYFYKSGSGEFGEYEKMIDKLTDNLDQVNILGDEKEYVKKIQALKNRIEDLDTDYMGYDEGELLTTISKGTEIKEKINDLIEEYLNKIEEKYVSEGLKHYSDIVEQLRDRTGSFAPSGRKRARGLLGEGSQNTSTIKKFTEKVNDTKLKQIREEAYKTKQQPLSKTIPQEANAGVPKFQVKNKAQSYFQEKLKQGLAEAKKDGDIADFSESRPKAIDGRMGYRIPGGGGGGGGLMSTPMGDGMYVGFDKKSVATFYGDYELPVEKNMERVKTYDLSSIKWLAENELPKDMRRNGNAFRKMTEKEQKKLAQRRKDYALQNGYDGILYYDPYTDNLIEGVVFKPVKEMDGLPKLQAKDVGVLKLKTKKTNTVGIPKSKQEFVEKYNAYPDGIGVGLKQMKPHALIKFEELFPSEWDNRKDVEEMEGSKQITDTYADNWRMKEMDPVLVTFRDGRRYVEDGHHRMLSIIKYATKKGKSPNRMKVPVYFSDTTLGELREDTHKSGMTQLLMNVEDIELKIRI